MQPVLNVEDVKKVELHLQDVGVSISELMHRAGVACAREVLNLEHSASVVVMCGFGNNAGDGWVAAKYLHTKGVKVQVVTPCALDDLQGDLVRMCAKSAEAAGVSVHIAPPKSELETILFDSDVVIDAVFGTGFRGRVHEPFSIWIPCVNECGSYVVAIDVPSGLSAQTGLTQGPCVVANLTVAMLALKPGLLADEGRDVCGSIIVAPLAEQTEYLVREAEPCAWRLDASDYTSVLPQTSKACDKYTRGSVLVVAGSTRFPGASILAATAAMRSGAGYVTLAVPKPIVEIVQARLIDAIVIGLPATPEGVFAQEAAPIIADLAKRHKSVLVGPGMRVSSSTVHVVSTLLASACPLVVDADGLNCLARLTSNRLDSFPEIIRRHAPLILTPHRKELARLVGLTDTPPQSLSAIMEAARRIVWSDGGSELVVVAKSSAPACVATDVTLLPKPGPAALATAGSGDVLAGLMAALLARVKVSNDDLPLLAALGCEIHGQAGILAQRRFGSTGVMAHDLADELGHSMDMFSGEVHMSDFDEDASFVSSNESDA